MGRSGTLPKYGERRMSADGIDCHICGKPFHALGTHIRFAHGMNVSEYRREFGLGRRGLISEQFLDKLRVHAENVKLGEAGVPTRSAVPPQRVTISAESRLKSGENIRRGQQKRWARS